jgi:hypothetical protein
MNPSIYFLDETNIDMEVIFSMIKALSKKTKEENHLDKYSNKYLVLRNLERAVEKLKEARIDLHWAVIEAIEMGVKADDIAEDVFFAVVEAVKEDWNIKDLEIPSVTQFSS